MSTALVIGKFYPPHAGHHLLIDYALAEAQATTVIVIGASSDSIPVAERVSWLRSAHPAADVLGRTIDMPVDYSSRAADYAWAKAVHQVLADAGRSVPDQVYSSEDYGERLATDLTALSGHAVGHRMVDRARIAIPISATQIRHDLRTHWRHLAASTRLGLAQRVVACGAESTGTTTLSRALAEAYQTVWVPEYGRLYSEATGAHHEWTTRDFEHIIERQLQMEDDLVARGGALAFCDTDPIATLMFHELYLGEPMDEAAVEAAVSVARRRTRYLLTDHVGVPFEDDGTRLFEQRRAWSTQWFVDFFETHDIAYERLTGTHEERLAQAIAVIEAIEPPSFVDPVEAGKTEAITDEPMTRTSEQTPVMREPEAALAVVAVATPGGGEDPMALQPLGDCTPMSRVARRDVAALRGWSDHVIEDRPSTRASSPDPVATARCERCRGKGSTSRCPACGTHTGTHWHDYCPSMVESVCAECAGSGVQPTV